ncbi:MAG: BrnA antitoxin family protein [Planctomycetes bacterium]|jgi:hypothetical protein|nr:BrnA antitoxin family protein [Planctomycetota bacterium]
MRLKKQVTLRLGVDVIEYFKALAEETGIPYQNLINLYSANAPRPAKTPPSPGRPEARDGRQTSHF